MRRREGGKTIASSTDGRSGRRRIVPFVPILAWASRYQRPWLRPDIIAGVTVAALVVPKSLGYAGIAGVPIQDGLYAGAAGAILYAVFGTSRQVATGPSSALAAVAGGAVATAAISGNEEATALVSAIAIAAGALFLLMSILRMGWISQFLSKAVITGFLFGAAIQVVVGELDKVTGTQSKGTSSWQAFGSWISGLDDLDRTTLLVGLIGLLLIFGLRAVAPRIPGALVLVVGGLAATSLFDLGARGVGLVGHVPSGLPTPLIPDLDVVRGNAAAIGTAALAIVLIGFSQTAGDARLFASRHRYRVDINQESLAQGMANVGSGLLQGIPVSTSLSASSLNDAVGAKSQMASLVTGGIVLLTLVALAPLFSDLPEPILAAVIIEAVITGMMDVAEMRRMFRVKRSDFWIAVAAILGVLTFGVLAGVVIGVALSVGWLVYVNATPTMPVLGRLPGTHVFGDSATHPESEQTPRLLVVRLEGGLFFVTADALGDRIRHLDLSADPPLTAVVLDCMSINFIDSQGSGEITKLTDAAKTHGISLRLARVQPAVQEVLARDGVIDGIGADHVHEDVDAAVQAEIASRSTDR